MTRKKKIILALLILACLGLISKASIHLYLNSASARNLLVEKLSKNSRQVSLKDHSFSFFTGLTFSGLKVTETKKGESREIEIPSASLNYNHFFYFRGLPAFQTLEIKDAEIYISKFKAEKTTSSSTSKETKATSLTALPTEKKQLSEVPEILTDIQFKNMNLTVNKEGKTTTLKGLDLSFNTESDFRLNVKELSQDKIGLRNIELRSKGSAENFQTFLALLAQEKLKDRYDIQTLKKLDSAIQFKLSSQAKTDNSPISQALQMKADSSLSARASFDTNTQSFDINEAILKSGNISLKAQGLVELKEEQLKLKLEQLPSTDLSLKLDITGSFDKPKYKSNNKLLNKFVFDKL